jgi:hypothetical protein
MTVLRIYSSLVWLAAVPSANVLAASRSSRSASSACTLTSNTEFGVHVGFFGIGSQPGAKRYS